MLGYAVLALWENLRCSCPHGEINVCSTAHYIKPHSGTCCKSSVAEKSAFLMEITSWLLELLGMLKA